MKIALISFARRGGMVHFHAELANAMGEIAQVVVVAAAGASASYFSRRLTILRVNTGRSALGSLAAAMNPLMWIRLMEKLGRAEIDVFHIVAAHEWNPLMALIIKGLHKPLVYTVHDPSAHQGAPLRMRISDGLVARQADAVVALTDSGSGQLRKRGIPERRIFCIPHGAYTFLTRRLRQRRPQVNMILCAGRIERYKGLDILLAAFTRISASIPGWRLVIAGSGSLPPEAAKYDTPDIQIINRYISDHELASLLQKARIVVFPYREATQSGMLAAAYAFGRPVIATRVGGLPEMVLAGRTGLIIPPNDPEALGRAIQNLVRNPRRLKQMGRNALALSRGRWAWKRIAKLHITMYESVLEDGRAS